MKILSIDGGGVRGLIPGMVIVEIEKRMGKPISELFDLISGTSAGGHIALALATPGKDGKPKWSAPELAAYYREAYGQFASNGILFNHESPQRGETFVTRKITRATAKIALGLDNCLYLGNLNSQRDWGHAKDYIGVMY